jgi:hypothetical protein
MVYEARGGELGLKKSPKSYVNVNREVKYGFVLLRTYRRIVANYVN